MSKPQDARSYFVPAPIDGLNLIAPPQLIGETECRVLDNYYVFDSGIRERDVAGVFESAGGGPYAMYSFLSVDGQHTLMSAESSVQIIAEDGTYAELSNTANGYFLHAFAFNKMIFMPRPALDTIATYNMVSDTFAATSFTVPAGKQINYGFAFRNRCYFFDENTATIYYGDVAAITGAIDGTGGVGGSFDFGQVLQRGYRLTWGCAWSYNQGDVNSELMVVGNDQGEVLIYEGDYPASASWHLVSRLEIPPPLGFVNDTFGGIWDTNYTQPMRVGQDLLIPTSRGIVSLAQIFAGRQDEERYYNISRKIGPVFRDGPHARSLAHPFAYFVGDELNVLWVLNYERGAWSRFVFDEGVEIYTVTCSGATRESGQFVSYLLLTVDIADVSYLWRMEEPSATASSDPSSTYKWHSRFFDFGRDTQKKSQFVRVLARDIDEESISNTLKISTEFDDSTVGASDTKTTTVTDDGYKLQELAPPGVGKYLSYMFEKAGGSAQNEIAGFTATFTEGGSY